MMRAILYTIYDMQACCMFIIGLMDIDHAHVVYCVHKSILKGISEMIGSDWC
jgi:hypothetical protein